MSLFSKFQQWHNGGLVEKPVKTPVNRVKPRLKSERLANGILFWRVENIPMMTFDNSDWDAAYYWVTRRNNQELGKYLAKKEKQK